MKKLFFWLLLLCVTFGICSCESEKNEGTAVPVGAEYVADSAQKSSYTAGEVFDCTGAKIKVVYDNATEATKDVTAEMVSNQPLAVGTQQVMVTYAENGKAVVCYIPITVKQSASDDPEITLLSAEYIANSATKVSYAAGEVFDCTGAKIKVVYDNATEAIKDVTAEMVSNQPLAVGTQQVMVTYAENGKAVVCYIPITVKQPTSGDPEITLLSAEYIANSATKVSYAAGEVFDCTGAKIKVVYDNATEATKDVTAEMVSNQPLAVGTQFVTVTYSEGSTTVVAFIPVTVVDPNAAHKETAIAELLSNEKVVANKTDAGVALLLDEYSTKIRAAGSVGAITALVGDFETDLDAHLAAKAAVLAQFDDAALVAKINKLYAQFKADIEAVKIQAIANVKAASTITEAQNYFNAFAVAVDNKLAEQNLYQGDEGGGQIYDKIELLYQLEDYLFQVDQLKETAYYVFNDVDDEYQEIMNACAVARNQIFYWEKYITLVIDLNGVEEAMRTEIESQIAAIRAMLPDEM